MYLVSSYPLAVFLCVVTMLCWGSWANTQKLASREWRFQLFYWDYSIGVLLLALVLAFTLGSHGAAGRPFGADLVQGAGRNLGSAFFGGVIFNLANILLVAAIDVAGMAIAFPIGIGLALVLGVITTYAVKPAGNPMLLGLGVLGVAVAIVFDAVAYHRLSRGAGRASAKGIILSVVAGVLMGYFYKFVAQSMGAERGQLSPYTANVLFSAGLLVSSFLWNSLIMIRPFAGAPVPFGDYFTKGTPRLHLVGILGGLIWSLGFSLNILASTVASPALSYGLGQGATMVAALWGVFVWKEFKDAPRGTTPLLTAMFACFLAGLILLVSARS
jgi:glucose uptake protein